MTKELAQWKDVTKKKHLPISEDLGLQGKPHKRKISNERSISSCGQPLNEV